MRGVRVQEDEEDKLTAALQDCKSGECDALVLYNARARTLVCM